MIDWDFYSKRRNVNLARFIVTNNIESYEQLVSVLLDKGVTAPDKGLFQAAYAAAVPPIVSKPAKAKKTTRSTKPATKRRSTKRTTKSKSSK